MAGSLIKISETIITSPTANVTLTGIDSTYDVYVVNVNNVIPDTDQRYLEIRFTEGGTPHQGTNYSQAIKVLRTNTTYSNASYNDQSFAYGQVSFLGTGGNEMVNANYTIYQANNSSALTFATIQNTYRNYLGELFGDYGGFVLKQNSTVDGIYFFLSGTGNINSGSFTLYGLAK